MPAWAPQGVGLGCCASPAVLCCAVGSGWCEGGRLHAVHGLHDAPAGWGPAGCMSMIVTLQDSGKRIGTEAMTAHKALCPRLAGSGFRLHTKRHSFAIQRWSESQNRHTHDKAMIGSVRSRLALPGAQSHIYRSTAVEAAIGCKISIKCPHQK